MPYHISMYIYKGVHQGNQLLPVEAVEGLLVVF